MQNALFKSRWKSGSCGLCNKSVQKLERHHESYRPENCIYLCHECHHRVHFLPWQLDLNQKRKLILTRIGPEGRVQLAKEPKGLDHMAISYKSPTRMKKRDGINGNVGR